MNKKIVIGIVVVIVIIVAGTGFWKWENMQKQKNDQSQLQQIQNNNQQDGSMDWQLLNNNKIGISIEIPIDWEDKVSESSDSGIIGGIKVERKGVIKGDSYAPHGINGGDYYFIITARDGNSRAAKDFENYLNSPDDYSSNVSFGRKIILLDGTEALRNVIEGPGKTFDEQRGNNITYSFLKNGMYFETVIVYDGNGMSSGVGEKIFSTLKFTK